MKATLSSKLQLGINIRGLCIALSLVSLIALNALLKNYDSEQINPIVAFAIFIVSAFVFINVEKRINFDKVLLLQLIIVICYLLLFISLLSVSVNLWELKTIVEKSVTSNLLLKIAAGAIGVAVFEEITFRKILLDFLQKGMSTKFAVFWSSLGFFFLHFTFNPILFLSGIFYANLALRFRSLIATILLHGIFDFFGYLSKVEGLELSYLGDSLTASGWLAGCNIMTDLIFMGVLGIYITGAWLFNRFKKNSAI